MNHIRSNIKLNSHKSRLKISNSSFEHSKNTSSDNSKLDNKISKIHKANKNNSNISNISNANISNNATIDKDDKNVNKFIDKEINNDENLIKDKLNRKQQPTSQIKKPVFHSSRISNDTGEKKSNISSFHDITDKNKSTTGNKNISYSGISGNYGHLQNSLSEKRMKIASPSIKEKNKSSDKVVNKSIEKVIKSKSPGKSPWKSLEKQAEKSKSPRKSPKMIKEKSKSKERVDVVNSNINNMKNMKSS